MSDLNPRSKGKYIYQLHGVSKFFSTPSGRVSVLKDLDFMVEEGETLAIKGTSGSGKTTLLHLLGMLDTPCSGELLLNDRRVITLSSDEKARLRNKEIGFVFQFHHLLPEFSTLENVAMPAIIQGMNKKNAKNLAHAALEKVGLEHRIAHNVTTLSGGERQRAAIARAVLLKPKVLLADEPTGNLDEETGANIARILLDLNNDMKMTLVMVTHNMELASLMQKQYELRSGVLYGQNA